MFGGSNVQKVATSVSFQGVGIKAGMKTAVERKIKMSILRKTVS